MLALLIYTHKKNKENFLLFLFNLEISKQASFNLFSSKKMLGYKL